MADSTSAARVATPVRNLLGSFAAGDSQAALQSLKEARASGRLKDRTPEDDRSRSRRASRSTGTAQSPCATSTVLQPSLLLLREFAQKIKNREMSWRLTSEGRNQRWQIGPLLFYVTAGEITARTLQAMTALFDQETEGKRCHPRVIVSPIKLNMLEKDPLTGKTAFSGDEAFLVIVDTLRHSPFTTIPQPLQRRFMFSLYICRPFSKTICPEVYFFKKKERVRGTSKETVCWARENEFGHSCDVLPAAYYRLFFHLEELFEGAQQGESKAARYVAYFFSANVPQPDEEESACLAVASISEGYLLRLVVNMVTYLTADFSFWEKTQRGEYFQAGRALKERLGMACCDWFYQDATGLVSRPTTQAYDSRDCAIANSPRWASAFRLADQLGWHPGIPATCAADALLVLQHEAGMTSPEGTPDTAGFLQNCLDNMPDPEHVPALESMYRILCTDLRAWLTQEKEQRDGWRIFSSVEDEESKRAIQAKAAQKLAGQILLYMDALDFAQLTLAAQIQCVRMTVLEQDDLYQYMCFLNACITVAQQIYVLACCGGHANTAKQAFAWLDVLYICRHLEYHCSSTSRRYVVFQHGCAGCGAGKNIAYSRLAEAPFQTYRGELGQIAVAFKQAATPAFGPAVFKAWLSMIQFVYSTDDRNGAPGEVMAVQLGGPETKVHAWESPPTFSQAQ